MERTDGVIERAKSILRGDIGPKTTCDFETDARDTYPTRLSMLGVEISLLETDLKTIMLASEMPWKMADEGGDPCYDIMLNALSNIREVCYRLLAEKA